MLRTDSPAIAFDFDGTLINSGLDKGIHIMYAVWSAFRENGIGHYLHPEDIKTDIDRMLAAYILYPGAPRFQQLSALSNSLINQEADSVDEADLSVFPDDAAAVYPNIKSSYNRIYSRLNDTAAELYWRPFPAVPETLRKLAQSLDLYIASGVTEDLLFGDLERHSIDKNLFRGIFGGNLRGGADKAELLRGIRDRGYPGLLFVADSNRDLIYARQAGACFFRIRENEDFNRLTRSLENRLPDETENWTFTTEELDFFRRKTQTILQSILMTERYEDYKMITGIIHSPCDSD